MYKKLLNAIPAFFTVAAFYLLLNIEQKGDALGVVISLLPFIIGFVFFFLYYDFKNLKEAKEKKSENITAFISAAVFTLILSFGYICRGAKGNIFLSVLGFCVVVAGLFLFFKKFVYNLILFMDKHNAFSRSKRRDGKKVFLLSFLLFEAVFIFYMLLFFPGRISRDVTGQVFQYIGLYGMTDKYPPVHTKLLGSLYVGGISLFNGLGITSFANEAGGILFNCFIQLTFFALSLSYLIYTLYSININKKIIYITLLANTLIPLVPVFAVTVSYFVWYSGSLIFLISLSLRLKYKKYIKQDTSIPWYKRNFFDDTVFECGGLFVFLIAICLFGPFGMVAGIAFTACTLLQKLNTKKYIPITAISALITALIINGATRVERDRERDIPTHNIMQLARVITNEDDLSKEEKREVSALMRYEYIPMAYSEDTSLWVDNIHALVRVSGGEYNKDSIQKIWANVGARHKVEYLKSIYTLTGNYFDPLSHLSIKYEQRENNILSGLPDYTVFGYKAEEGILNFLYTLEKIPILNIVFSLPLMLWLTLLFLIYTLVKRKYEYVLYYLPFIVTWTATVITAEHINTFEALMPVACLYPLLATLPFYKRGDEEREKTAEE